jgi:hypothetical protein
MLNENVRITPADSANCQLAWTAPAGDWASWVFINGRHVRGPLVTGAPERMVKVPLAAQTIVSLEVHDLPSAEVQVDPVAPQPNTRPTIQWLAVADAVRYRVYHRGYGQTEERIFDGPAREGLERYEITCPVTLVAGWHFFRVEAVSAYGQESTRQAWAYFVMDVPDVPPLLRVTAGSADGLYNFALEN